MPSVSTAMGAMFQGYRQSRFRNKTFEGENEDFANTLVTGEVITVGCPEPSYSKVSMYDGKEAIRYSSRFGLSAGAGIQGLLDINGKMDATREITITENSVVIMLDTLVYQNNVRCNNARWKDNVELPSDPDNHGELKRFYEYYGDSFVSEVATGGRFVAVFSVHTISREHSHELIRKISGGGKVKGLDFTGEIESNLKDVLKRSRVKYDFMMLSSGLTGSGLKIPTLDSPVDDVFQFAACLKTKTTLDNPAILERNVSGYETVPDNMDFSRAFEPVRKNRDALFKAGDGFNATFNRLAEVNFSLNRIKAIHHLFGRHEEQEVVNAIKAVDEDLNTLGYLYDSYENNPGKPLPEDLQWQSSPDLNPEMAVDYVDSHIGLGKDKGQAFKLNVADKWKDSPLRIRAIRVDTGDGYIGNIKVFFERPLFTLQGRFEHIILGWEPLRVENTGKESAEEPFGEGGAGVLKWTANPLGFFDREYDEPTDDIHRAGKCVKEHFDDGPQKELSRDAYITGISGWSGDYVDKVDIMFNDGGQHLVAGIAELSNVVNWEVPKGECVIGFSGRATHAPLGALNPIRVVFNKTRLEA